MKILPKQAVIISQVTEGEGDDEVSFRVEVPYLSLTDEQKALVQTAVEEEVARNRK